MSRTHCDLYAEINGEPSKLYKDLLSKIKNRPLTNYIYALYLQQGVEAQMNNLGFKVNNQGQHSADAVYQFFDVASMQNESIRINDIAIKIGAKDSSGNYTNFADSKEALRIANESNSTNKATVSYVVKKGDVFNIITEVKDSRTQSRAFETEKQIAVWNILEQVFRGIGIDINNDFDFNRGLVNALDAKNFLGWLKILKNTRNDLLSKNEIRTILELDKNSQQVKRLQTIFGSLDRAADEIYNAFHGERNKYTEGQLSLMNSALDQCKKVQGLDLEGVINQVRQAEGDTWESSEEARVQDTLEELDKDYGIDIHEINRQGKSIETLAHAAQDAAFTLQRQLRKLQAEYEIIPEVKNLQQDINRLIKGIANKKYYAGVMGFLKEALIQVQTMEKLFQGANEISGTNMERNAARAKALMEIKSIREGYEHIVNALVNLDDILIGEELNTLEKESIIEEAKKVKEYFEKYDNRVKKLQEVTMIDLATTYLGESTPTGVAIANLVKMAEVDSSVWDNLYSVGRLSNPIAATMGNIIRDAQDERTKKLNEISLRIRRATNKLFKSGSDSSFMYESNNYIISDIDWEKYNREKYAARRKFINEGLVGLDLAEAMDIWEEEHTEHRVVDKVSGRKERVPDSNYRKEFPTLTAAQQEYYDEMMQIKGELSTLLPYYAQKQYLPPQKRRSTTDAILQSKGNGKLITKAILNKLKDLYTVREDDQLDAANGAIVDGEEYAVSGGALDNTPYRQIPIFYINRIEDQEELLKDFSGALQSFAAVAINYECMNSIKDTVEFIGDFIEDQEIAAKKGDKSQVDEVSSSAIRMFKKLNSFSKRTNTSAIVQSFIDQHIYGIKIKNVNKWTKILQTILSYTSIRALAVNVKGAISNTLMGEIQMLMEAGAGEFYNVADYIWAHKKVFGDNTVNAPGRIMDFVSNNVNSKSVLLAQIFDPLNEQFREQSNQRYHKGILRHLLGKDFTFIGYGAGEHMIHFVNMYAMLHNIKVKIDGKDATLYDAFYKTDKSDGNSELLLKDNVTYKNSDGNWVPVDDKYIEEIKGRIRYCNHSTHGAMNDEDKGVIHQHMLSKFAMNLRQWMVEHYSKRYRGVHWESSLKQFREGYYNTAGKFMMGLASDIFNFESEIALHWNEMEPWQKANCKRALSELLILSSLLTLSFALGEPEDHKKEFWYRMWIYQTKRAIMEVRGSTPIGIPMEITKMINSPIAATNTVNSLLYPFVGLPDINEKIKSGRYEGWNKYGRNLLKYSVPFYNQIDQLQNMDEDPAVFAVFNNSLR